MNEFYIIDGHCDTLEKYFDLEADIYKGGQTQLSIKGLKKGGVGLQFFACWISPNVKDSSLLRGLSLIDAYHNMLSSYQQHIHPVLSYEDISYARKQGKIATLLTVEGGEILEEKLYNLRILYRLGVRSLTLTWNYKNALADGALESDPKGGLSNFGHKVVKEMNKLGMLVDVSHISEKAFYDVIQVSSKPIAATHSNAYSVMKHPRNLNDAQIKAIARKKGIIGINFYPKFLTTEKKVYRKDIIRHIDYIASLVGIDILGFGSDFDGIEITPEDIRGPEAFELIINDLLRLNYKEADIKKIAHDNYRRVLKDVL